MEIWIVSSFWCCGIELLWMSEHIFQWTKALGISVEIYYKTGIIHCKVGVGIAFYLVCSILQPRSKVANRVSESRGVKKACVSRVSWWLVQGQRAGAKTPRGDLMPIQPETGEDSLGISFNFVWSSGKAEPNDRGIDFKNCKIFSLHSSFAH